MNFMFGPLSRSSDISHRHFHRSPRGTLWAIGLGMALAALSLSQPRAACCKDTLSCLAGITEEDALLVADPDGKILYRKNETRKCIPASTLKVLTAAAALDHFGPSYRFRTEFYLDPLQNLKVKGYGDPFLVSEVLEELADVLSSKIPSFRWLILDDSYFSPDIVIPGCDGSTNPYDAPVGAISANFNTIAFQRDKKGEIVSAEKQTPLVPFARDQIHSLDLPPGRHTFFFESRSAARYTGELLLYFLRKKGVACGGSIRSGTVGPEDRLIYTHTSTLPLETVVQNMMKSSSNFMANQLFLALGASLCGPPATLAKGVDAVAGFARKKPGLNAVRIVEGSGLSRENRLSAIDMLAVLKQFQPYRHLLREKHGVYYKTGSLKGIRTRVGYIENGPGEIYYFVIFFNQAHYKIDETLQCVKNEVCCRR